jgi:hypothetical protein
MSRYPPCSKELRIQEEVNDNMCVSGGGLLKVVGRKSLKIQCLLQCNAKIWRVRLKQNCQHTPFFGAKKRPEPSKTSISIWFRTIDKRLYDGVLNPPLILGHRHVDSTLPYRFLPIDRMCQRNP